MRAAEIFKPIGVFVVVLALIVGVAALAPSIVEEEPENETVNQTEGEGQYYSQQAPDQYEPDNALSGNLTDPEEGQLRITNQTNGTQRILIDTRHSNGFEQDNLEPVVNALIRAGHVVKYQGDVESDDPFESANYNATLRQFDALLIIAPTSSFTDQEVAGIEAFAEGGGRVVATGEPTQTSAGGIFSSSTTTRSTVSELSMEFGMKLGTDELYNIDDAKNDDNYRSIHGKWAAPGPVTNGVGTVDFETSGYIVLTNNSNARVKFRAANGTTRLSDRRAAEYPLVARTGNFVLVADSTFLFPTEVRDADNERFTSNLLNFLLTGEKPDDVPSAANETTTTDDGF
jgi:hypothetical protein